MTFEKTIFRCDEFVDKKKKHPQFHSKLLAWHGQECELLGHWIANGYDYCAIRFAWNNKYEYETCKPEYLV